MKSIYHLLVILIVNMTLVPMDRLIKICEDELKQVMEQRTTLADFYGTKHFDQSIYEEAKKNFLNYAEILLTAQITAQNIQKKQGNIEVTLPNVGFIVCSKKELLVTRTGTQLPQFFGKAMSAAGYHFLKAKWLQEQINNKGPAICYACANIDHLKQCAECLQVSYCSKKCQIEDWSLHKKVCKNNKSHE